MDDSFSSDPVESVREPGLGTARIDFSDCTAIFRINWPLDLVGYTGLRILLTRIIRGDWSGTVQMVMIGCVIHCGALLIRFGRRHSESLDFVLREYELEIWTTNFTMGFGYKIQLV